ncbi:MAG TPA: hypothetical protein VKY85_14420 [Candidatus Angelobacter sp.]|nr:hypothetical protein [Candidatus Angelobacter sp.]
MQKTTHEQRPGRLERLRKRYPGKTREELLEIKRFLDRHLEIALSIYLELTETSSRETFDQT